MNAMAQVAYNLMLQASWAVEGCGAGPDETACVLRLQEARDALCRHMDVPRMDYTGERYERLFGPRRVAISPPEEAR